MKNLKHIAILFAFSIIALNALAQENVADNKPLRIGVGVRANTLAQNELNMRVTPPAKLYFNFDIMKYVRADFQLGYYSKKSDQIFANNYKMALTDKSMVFTFGIFGMYKVDKVNFYGGFRFGTIVYSTQDAFYQYNASTPSRYTNKGTTGTTFITFGGEYFLHPKFSVTAELGLGIYKDTFKPGNPGLPSAPPVEKNKITGTEAGLIFRFYPL